MGAKQSPFFACRYATEGWMHPWVDLKLETDPRAPAWLRYAVVAAVCPVAATLAAMGFNWLAKQLNWRWSMPKWLVPVTAVTDEEATFTDAVAGRLASMHPGLATMAKDQQQRALLDVMRAQVRVQPAISLTTAHYLAGNIAQRALELQLASRDAFAPVQPERSRWWGGWW